MVRAGSFMVSLPELFVFPEREAYDSAGGPTTANEGQRHNRGPNLCPAPAMALYPRQHSSFPR